ncbi:hypothetical protein FLJC2902T_17660 [Flavobacterium limnosediminis JC2902]|uniref:Uncharacterized protein n=1 Tax=Flavobacterium limnosediminis JC2902 TaxID=1341181 RepID=V6SP57_9FLAO|nr:hypothetical protein [Flavobacterium limnosediminis]ESU28406.1 hypothetical protein FLJC2902T_17660 [Flavobacterium limnosediminis JC2902]
MATEKKTTRKKNQTARTVCRKVIKVEGLKVDGTLKKGYKYAPGGRIVKVATAKKETEKKKPAAKKKSVSKKRHKSFLSFLGL